MYKIMKINITEDLSKLELDEVWTDGNTSHYQKETTLEYDKFDIDVKAKIEIVYKTDPGDIDHPPTSEEDYRDLFCMEFKIWTKDGEEISKNDLEIVFNEDEVRDSISIS